MDWLEEKIEHTRMRIRNTRFCTAITAYILVAAAAAMFLSYVTIIFCFQWESRILQSYNNGEDIWIYSVNLSGWPLWTQTLSSLSSRDSRLVNLLDFVRTWCPFLYTLVGSILACRIFYRRRLSAPLRILQEGTEAVRNNNLDFDLTYDSRDEMGELCRSFDEMKQELIHNKQMMWELVENQKQLNAAFAHDLRTPLTVLKGYSDFLARYIPQGKVNEEKMLDTLHLMSSHLNRLEQYSRTMKGIRSIDELPVHREKSDLSRIENEIREVIFSLNQIGDIQITLAVTAEKSEDAMLFADTGLILEVLENLLSNAIRYAESRIRVRLDFEHKTELLVLTVHDDGPGFTQGDLQNALNPYYKEHRASDAAGGEEDPHFGIGLHICSHICAKHEGTLSIANSIDQGAVVTASFSCKNE